MKLFDRIKRLFRRGQNAAIEIEVVLVNATNQPVQAIASHGEPTTIPAFRFTKFFASATGRYVLLVATVSASNSSGNAGESDEPDAGVPAKLPPDPQGGVTLKFPSSNTIELCSGDVLLPAVHSAF